MANPLPAQHSPQNPEAVHGTSDAHTVIRGKAPDYSKMKRDHPTLKPKTNFQPRKNATGSNHGGS